MPLLRTGPNGRTPAARGLAALVLRAASLAVWCASPAAHAAFPSQIVVASTAGSELATQTERWAASQLATLMSLPVVELHANMSSGSMCSTIAVGHAAAVALGVRPEALAALGDEEFVLTTHADKNSIAVGSGPRSPRGAMYVGPCPAPAVANVYATPVCCRRCRRCRTSCVCGQPFSRLNVGLAVAHEDAKTHTRHQ